MRRKRGDHDINATSSSESHIRLQLDKRDDGQRHASATLHHRRARMRAHSAEESIKDVGARSTCCIFCTVVYQMGKRMACD